MGLYRVADVKLKLLGFQFGSDPSTLLSLYAILHGRSKRTSLGHVIATTNSRTRARLKIYATLGSQDSEPSQAHHF